MKIRKKAKKIKWANPILVDLGSAMSFGVADCDVGSSPAFCVGGPGFDGRG